MRWLGYFLLFLLVIVIVCIGAAAFVLYTPAGTKLALDLVIPRIPGTLSIETQQGALARELVLENISYQAPNEPAPDAHKSPNAFSISVGSLELKFDLTAFWFDRVIHLNHLRINQTRVQLPHSSDTEPSPIQIVLPTLPVSLRIDTIEITDTKIKPMDTTNIPDVKARLEWDANELAINDLDIAGEDYQINGSLTGVTAKTQRLSGNLKLNWPTHELQGALQISGTLDEPQLQLQLSSPVNLESKIRVKLAGEVTPIFEARIAVPFYEQGDWKLNQVLLQLDGKATDYHFQATAGVDHSAGYSGRWSSQGSGNTQQVEISQFQLSDKNYELDGRASVNWQTPLRFTLSARSGTNTLEAHGHLDQGWPLVDAQFNGPDLTTIMPGLAGDLKLLASTGGSRTSPHLKLNFDSGSLTWKTMGMNLLRGDLNFKNNRAAMKLQANTAHLNENTKLTSMDLSLQLDRLLAPGEIRLNNKNPTWSSKLTVGQLQLPTEILVNEFGMELEGNSSNQEIHLDYQLEDRKGIVDANLQHTGLNFDHLEITLQESTALALPGFDLKADGKVQAKWEAGSMDLQPHCWQVTLGKLCVEEARWSPETWASRGHLDLADLNSLVQPFLPTWQVDAQVAGQWKFSAADTIGGDAEFKITDGKIQQLSKTGPLTMAEAVSGALIVKLQNTQAHAQLNLEAGGGHRLNMTVDSMGLDRDATISGTGQLMVNNLELIENWISDLDQVTGSLNATIDLKGTLTTPLINAEFALKEGGGRWREPYLSFKNLDMQAQLDEAQNMQLSAVAQVGSSGKIDVQASAREILGKQRQLEARIKGEQIKVRQDKIELVLSPDLTLQSNRERHRAEGSLLVDSASIEIEALPETAVAHSDDIVVVGAETSTATTTPLEANINIKLGKAVQFTAFGLNTGLKGDLNLLSEPKRAPQLVGRVDLVKGEFSAYGQDLTIKQGNLTFTGPLDNPFVDLRAVRIIPGDESIEVGVHVQGPANDLRSSLFSNPTMAEADVLSYLLLGRQLNSGNSAEGNQLATAAIGLGLRTAAPLIENLRQNFGLDELGAQGAEDGDVAIVAGKRISSKLYVRYTYRAFSQFGALLLDYALAKRWRLEASASQQPAVDLIYKVGGE